MTTVVDRSMLLDDQLCFLIYRLHRGLTDQYRPVLQALGLTYPQYLVMLVLWESESMTVGEIGSRLHLDTGTLSPLLKRLETAGLIRRNRAQHDERTVVVGLTIKGQHLREKTRRATSAMDECLVDRPADASDLHVQLSKLVSRVDEVNKR